MPLILCPDCNQKMSTEAASCPQCGRPAEKAKTLTGLKVGFPAFFIVVGLIVFAIGATGTTSPTHQSLRMLGGFILGIGVILLMAKIIAFLSQKN